MAFSLPLPGPWTSQGWKAKIRDKERTEPPHVTILRGTRAWRFSLRSSEFLDGIPDPKHVPQDLVDVVRQALPELISEWDKMYPENPVSSTGGDDD